MLVVVTESGRLEHPLIADRPEYTLVVIRRLLSVVSGWAVWQVHPGGT